MSSSDMFGVFIYIKLSNRSLTHSTTTLVLTCAKLATIFCVEECKRKRIKFENMRFPKQNTNLNRFFTADTQTKFNKLLV